MENWGAGPLAYEEEAKDDFPNVRPFSVAA